MKELDTISMVKSFWGTEACGSHFIQNFSDDKEFYERYSQFRYQSEWHLPILVPFESGKGKKVLEIGCGNGADGVRWAQHGAIYTGVDLTETAVQATKRHFQVMGLSGTFQVENAESLSFEDETFDIVYSHGVLHHSPTPVKAFKEVKRVLKPGGKAILMLYHKHSFNYYIRILGYMRLRTIIKILSRLGRFDADRKKLVNKLVGIRGNDNKSVWTLHYEQFLRRGWNYLKAENFVHHCTDGPECPFAYVFSKNDIKRLFADWKSVEYKVAHFPLKKYKFGQFIPFWVEKTLASLMGWYLFIYATK